MIGWIQLGYICMDYLKEIYLMTVKLTRRKMIQAAGAVTLAPSVVAAKPVLMRWPIMEGPDTPKLCLGLGDGGRAPEGRQNNGIRRIKQLGVGYVLSGGRS